MKGSAENEIKHGKFGKHLDIRDIDDEIVAEGKIHFEALDEHVWYVGIDTPDGYSLNLQIIAEKGKIRLMVYELNEPEGTQ